MEPYRRRNVAAADSLPSSSRYHQVPPPPIINNNLTSSSSGDYSDSCSSSSDTSRSSSWSSVSSREWESHVDQHGELFYVEFGSNLIPDVPRGEPAAGGNEDEPKKKKKKKGRLSRLLKRRQGAASAQPRSRSESPVYLPTESLQQTPADDWSDWSSFTLELEVQNPSGALDVSSNSGGRSGAPGRRMVGGGGSNLCEALLGFTPGSTQSAEWHGQAPLRQRVIVDRLVPGGPLHQGFAHVQPGDWLEKLNGRDVTHRDLNGILSSINSREIVELNFRRKPPGRQLVEPQQHTSRRNRDVNDGNSTTMDPSLTTTDQPAAASTRQPSTMLPHGILLLSQENVTDTSHETADILYQSEEGGGGGARIDPLLKWRGAAVTLAHLMPQLTSGSTPAGSTVILDGQAIHMAYVVEHPALFLIAAPSAWCGMVELQCLARQLASLFRFQYGSIRRALTDPRWADEIRRMVDSLFSSLHPSVPVIPAAQAAAKTGVGETTIGGSSLSRPANRLSNFFTTCGQWLPLPPESHLDVTLTLNQMEAMDYEDWDEEGISVQRSATIVGSAVYCQGYLVASTLTGQRLEQIGMFLKWNHILEMSYRRRLKELILWREVFLEEGDRSFILVVGSGHILVAALLQGGGAAQPWDNYPDSFVIDETQFFLKELEFLGLETTCNQILNGPPNPCLVTNLSSNNEATAATDGNDPDHQLTFNITPGMKPTLINYLSMDFGTGVLIAPTLISAAPKFSEQFQRTSMTIHKLFEQTLKAKVDLQRPDWGGPWSDKSLVALQEVTVCFSVPENASSPSGTNKESLSFNVTGRLFTSPVHRELFVCYQDSVAQDILDLAFHLGFGALML